MLVLQLFTGMEEIPQVHMMDLNSQEAIDKYLEKVSEHLNSEDGISEDGKKFLHDCLTYDKEERPTARQLLKNRWLQESSKDNAFFRELEKQSIDPWVPRGVMLPVIEDLWLDSGTSVEVEPAQPREAFDDVSPHFGANNSFIQVCQQGHSLEPTTAIDKGVERRDQASTAQPTFQPLSPRSLRSALKEVKLGCKRRPGILDGRISKRRRLYSL